MNNIRVGGRNSKDIKGLRVTGWDRQVFPESRDHLEYLPGVDGPVHFSQPFGARTDTIFFKAMFKDETARMTLLESIKIWLYSREFTKIEYSDQPDRYYLGKVLDDTPLNPRYFSAQFGIAFTAMPFAYAHTAKDLEYSGNTVLEDDAFKVISNGTAHSEFILELTPDTTIANLDINIDGVRLTFKGEIKAGETITIDTKEFTAFIDSSNKTIDLIGEFPVIYAGENNIKFKANAEFTYTARIEFIERYL